MCTDGPGLLRAAARSALLVGAGGSLVLMLRAGRNTPRLLLVGFVFWVLSPFAALAWANLATRRWTELTRAVVYWVTLAVALGSLAFYGGLLAPPKGSANAFVFTIVPPVSCLFIAIALAIATTISRSQSDPE